MRIKTDVDIDVFNREIILEKIPHVDAMINSNGDIKRHNTGVYFQRIPKNPFTNISTIDHEVAEGLGFFKVDILNNSIYDGVRDEAHLVELLEKEPNWDLLEHSEFVEQLYQIGSYPQLLKKLKPRNIEQLSMVLAVIRPSKKHLQNSTWDVIEKEVWVKPTDGQYHYKKSHSIAFAASIVVQMNLIVERLSTSCP